MHVISVVLDVPKIMNDAENRSVFSSLCKFALPQLVVDEFDDGFIMISGASSAKVAKLSLGGPELMRSEIFGPTKMC